MVKKIFAGATLAAVLTFSGSAVFAQSSGGDIPTQSRYLPEYAASGELIQPKNYREWVHAGSPVTPNARQERRGVDTVLSPAGQMKGPLSMVRKP